jgi:hypothetical protein
MIIGRKGRGNASNGGAGLLGLALFVVSSMMVVPSFSGSAASALLSDTVPPKVAIISPGNSTNFALPKSSSAVAVQVTGTSSDKGTGVTQVQLSLNGGAYQAVSPKAPGDWSTWSSGTFTLGLGSYSFIAKATDGSGNVAYSTQVMLKVVSQPSRIINIVIAKSDPASQAVIMKHLTTADIVSSFSLTALGKFPGQKHLLEANSIPVIEQGITTAKSSSIRLDYIGYDNEAANGAGSTPPSELVNPAASTNQAMSIIKAAGYSSGISPTRRILLSEYAGLDYSQINSVDIQLQKVVGNSQFQSVPGTVIPYAKAKNSGVTAMIRVCPTLFSVTDIINSVNTVSSQIDGVTILWNGSDPSVLDNLLTQLGR